MVKIETSWRANSAPCKDAKKLRLMRKAKTEVEARHNLGGMAKRKRPITLVKMPWQEPKS